MSTSQASDGVERIIQQWQQQRPDLSDLTAMAIIGRVRRCAALLQPRLEHTFAEFDLTAWEFDVLATLRRSGAPYCLSPTALFSALMVSSGTMTHRLQRLEQSGLIERVANPHDARSLLVQLSPAGLSLIEQAVTAHLANEQRILARLSAEQQTALNQQLMQLLALLE